MSSTSTLSSSRTSTSSPQSATPLWDARKTLEIASDGRCVGHAVSKGRKCRITLADHNVDRGNTMLKDLAAQRPDPNALRGKLRLLAEVLLCPRWHQNQAQSMLNDWVELIEVAYPRSHIEVETQRTSSRMTLASPSGSSRREVTSSRSRTSTTTTTMVELGTSERAMLQARIAATEEMLETMMRQQVATQERLEAMLRRITEQESTGSSTSTPPLSTSPPPPSTSTLSSSTPTSPSFTSTSPRRQLPEQEDSGSSTSTTPGSTPTVSRVSTSDISSLALSRTSTASSTPPITTRLNEDARPSSPRTCTRTHVRRRAIEDECPICREDFLRHDKLVWCKNSCGNTVHRECFEAWEAQCRVGNRTANCMICRADWASCDSCDG